MRKPTYHLTFVFENTEEAARSFCDRFNSELTPYQKRAGKIATFSPWSSADGKEQKFICWHYYKA